MKVFAKSFHMYKYIPCVFFIVSNSNRQTNNPIMKEEKEPNKNKMQFIKVAVSRMIFFYFKIYVFRLLR